MQNYYKKLFLIPLQLIVIYHIRKVTPYDSYMASDDGIQMSALVYLCKDYRSQKKEWKLGYDVIKMCVHKICIW